VILLNQRRSKPQFVVKELWKTRWFGEQRRTARLTHGRASTEEWDKVINVNLRAAFLSAKYLSAPFKVQRFYYQYSSTRALMSEPDSEAYCRVKRRLLSLTTRCPQPEKRRLR